MAKAKNETVFFCTQCGYESKKWMGQCPACRAWNTFSEETVSTDAKAAGRSSSAAKRPEPVRLSEVSADAELRIDSGFEEFSRVLGGGIVPGSVVLIGGDPGVGKSTLLLQSASLVAAGGNKVLYVSGEESLKQIKLRADRTVTVPDTMSFLSHTDIDDIIAVMEKEKPGLCIIDSIQTMSTSDSQSVPGSVSQVRECAQRLTMCAKQQNIAVFLVGHVTKEGTVAGPRVLEHIVDTVCYFEADDNFSYRILRSAKNRFGSTNEIGVFEMTGEGLKEVPNPSEYLLAGRPEKASGAVVTCLTEGSRVILLEVQGLVAETQYGMARRQTNGMDYNRLNMLLAVLMKRAGLNLSNMDAYINIAGGMKITNPSADLAVVAAIISSYKNRAVPEDTAVFGEVGLSGEVRSVPQVQDRIKEAEKLGFRRIILPAVCLKGLMHTGNAELTGVRFVSELLSLI